MEGQNQPENVPEKCVGPQSEQAGKASACEGCPNRAKCSSGQFRKADPNLQLIREAMKPIKNKILVLSGKGGCGKSTISCQLSLGLARHKESMQDDDEQEGGDLQVGLLDVDLCGPSVPRMMNLENGQMRQSNRGMVPVYKTDNLGVVSIGFAIGKEDPVIWRGPKKNSLIQQFLKDVDWGDNLDFLVIDFPPGTGDEAITVGNYMKHVDIQGAVIVTTPQDLSCADVRRQINFCFKSKIPIIGVVENMSGFVCPNCKTETEIFMPSKGGAEKMCQDFKIPLLGKVPLDPRLMKACEEGKSILDSAPDSMVAKSFDKIVQQVLEKRVQ